MMIADAQIDGDRVGETLALGSDEAFIGALSYDLIEVGSNEGGLLIYSDLPASDCDN